MIINNAKLTVAALALLSFMTTTAFAESRPYFGGQLGYGKSGSEYTLNGSGIAGNLFAGYQFNSYFATELGWTTFHNVNKTYNMGFSTAGTTVKTNAVDLVGKVILPVTSKLDLYGKLGVAYVMQNYDVSFNDRIERGMGYAISFNEYAWLPTFGIGESYHFTPKLAMDVSYNRIQRVGNTTIGSSDFLGVGLTYSFN